uniref:Chromo domain-containing protein n=1 Tax=Palpitomonas bilix TaxID=652834 RepID=A0A7S3FX75_9EUKA|mmetsp:Transcript_10243/g.26836  ORF Transcript_10243/g.26836 Transcript_10243/m.26836 type:complete len:258 (+) Transcript_10243:192-965(+)
MVKSKKKRAAEEEEEDYLSGEYEIERILKHDDETWNFLIQWKGYNDTDETTWQPYKDVANVKELDDYLDKLEKAHAKLPDVILKLEGTKRKRRGEIKTESEKKNEKKSEKKSEKNSEKKSAAEKVEMKKEEAPTKKRRTSRTNEIADISQMPLKKREHCEGDNGGQDVRGVLTGVLHLLCRSYTSICNRVSRSTFLCVCERRATTAVYPTFQLKFCTPRFRYSQKLGTKTVKGPLNLFVQVAVDKVIEFFLRHLCFE